MRSLRFVGGSERWLRCQVTRALPMKCSLRQVPVWVLVASAAALWNTSLSLAAAEPEVEAEVTVRARAVRSTERYAPTAYATEVETERYAAELKTVTEALSDTAGVSVRRYGGLGAFATLSVRGSSSNQVQVYFDGIPLSRAQNEVVNLADLPIDSLERIEVYRGVTPVHFSVAGLGGAVNLVPKREGRTQVTVGYGSFTTRKAVATHSSPIGSWRVLAHLAYLGSAGNFRFRSDNDTPQNPYDDREVTRVHNGFDSLDLLLSAHGPTWGSLHPEVLQEAYWKTSDLPGRGANPSLHAKGERIRLLDAVRLRATGWPVPASEATFTLHNTWEQSAFRDPFGELGAGQQDRDDATWVFGLDATGTWCGSSFASVSGLAAMSHEWFWPDNDAHNAPEESAARRLRATLALQPDFVLWHDRMRLVPFVRWEHLRDATEKSVRSFGRVVPRRSIEWDLLSPGIGVLYEVGSGLTLLANTGRYERAPSLLEQFGLSGTVLGNPALVPESAWNRDVGVRYEFSSTGWVNRGRLEYAYFDNEVSDLIVFVQRSAAIFRPENVGRARLRGHEVSAHVERLGPFTVDANFTQQDAENRSRVQGGIYLGKQLPGRPRYELYARLSFRWQTWEPYYELNWISGNVLDLANFQRVPARGLHGVGVAFQLRQQFRFLLQVQNLTDDQISDIGGFPLPGRALVGTVTWNLY